LSEDDAIDYGFSSSFSPSSSPSSSFIVGACISMEISGDEIECQESASDCASGDHIFWSIARPCGAQNGGEIEIVATISRETNLGLSDLSDLGDLHKLFVVRGRDRISAKVS
jgi:hypothetical protein